VRDSRRIRLAGVAAGPVIYQTPLYRRLASDPRLELSVIFASSNGVRPYDAGFGGRQVVWDEDLLDGYTHEFLQSAETNELADGFLGLRDWDVIAQIRRSHYDAIWIHGYSYFGSPSSPRG
jgi:hypothetical protein